MKFGKKFFITIALFNLCIVAALGVLLRTKMVFSIESVEFSNVLEAHYHFAMNGWVTLTIMTLMVYELLPEFINNKPKYRWMLWGVLMSSYGLGISFIINGYNIATMTFISIYIVIAIAFAWIFSRDLIKTKPPKPILILSICAMVSLVLSCIGPETFLGYVLAAHSMNVLVFRDTAYTYLHFQYNGFFPMAIFALFFNYLNGKGISLNTQRNMRNIAIMLPATIIPTLFLSYLWHYPNIYVRSIAIIGCIGLYIYLFMFYRFLQSTWSILKQMNSYAKFLGIIVIIAVTIKIILQTGTAIPYVGIIVFGNRPIIIGYIHLVMLGFITLYLLSHLLRNDLLDGNDAFTRVAILIFSSGVIINEVLLMLQGLTQIFMKFYPIFMWLLWGTMIWLVSGAILIFISRIKLINQAKD